MQCVFDCRTIPLSLTFVYLQVNVTHLLNCPSWHFNVHIFTYFLALLPTGLMRRNVSRKPTWRKLNARQNLKFSAFYFKKQARNSVRLHSCPIFWEITLKTPLMKTPRNATTSGVKMPRERQKNKRRLQMTLKCRYATKSTGLISSQENVRRRRRHSLKSSLDLSADVYTLTAAPGHNNYDAGLSCEFSHDASVTWKRLENRLKWSPNKSLSNDVKDHFTKLFRYYLC